MATEKGPVDKSVPSGNKNKTIKTLREIMKSIPKNAGVGAGAAIDQLIKNLPKDFLSRRRKLRENVGEQTPQLMPTTNLIERKVPRGEKPNMLDVAGGAKTVRVAKGGLIKKKKSKKSGRAAKRGYGIAKRG